MKPFLKWAGGKAKLLPELLKHAPKTFGTYWEPFVGGGALFFALQPERACLSDVNADLITTYKAVRSETSALISTLENYARQHNEEFYYAVRARDARAYGHAWQDYQVAARFIYLNKTCFNGLYRVNKQGAFNVPFGRYTNPAICDAENLRACSDALRFTKLDCYNFHRIEAIVDPGDFVYFDPPYVPISTTANFTKYDAAGFGMAEQTALRDMALRLKRRGVHVMLSNAGTDVVRELYKGFDIYEVAAPRAINSKGGKRGAVPEFIIR